MGAWGKDLRMICSEAIFRQRSKLLRLLEGLPPPCTPPGMRGQPPGVPGSPWPALGGQRKLAPHTEAAASPLPSRCAGRPRPGGSSLGLGLRWVMRPVHCLPHDPGPRSPQGLPRTPWSPAWPSCSGQDSSDTAGGRSSCSFVSWAGGGRLPHHQTPGAGEVTCIRDGSLSPQAASVCRGRQLAPRVGLSSEHTGRAADSPNSPFVHSFIHLLIPSLSHSSFDQ